VSAAVQGIVEQTRITGERGKEEKKENKRKKKCAGTGSTYILKIFSLLLV
jgi:hypothetical protein